MTAIISLLVVLLLSMSLTRIGAVALRLTGLTIDSARFQARSAFTGCGYTTTEAEQVVQHPVRRRIAGWLMMAGNLQIAAVSAAAILSFLGLSQDASLVQILTLVIGLLAVYLFAISPLVDRIMCGVTSKLLRTFTNLDTRDFRSLLHLGGEYAVAELPIAHTHPFEGLKIEDAIPYSCGSIVLGVAEDDGAYMGLPPSDHVIRPHSTLIVYGTAADVSKLNRGDLNTTAESRDD